MKNRNATEQFHEGRASDADGIHVLVVSNHQEARRKSPSAMVFVDRQVTSLKNAGVQVSLFDIGGSHSFFNLFRKWRELCREVHRLKPQLVHARYGTSVAALSVLAGPPAVITFCGSDLNPGAPVSILRVSLGLLLSNLAALRARRLICVSQGLRQALWWRQDRAVVIPDGIDLNLFTPGPQDQARTELGWDHTSPVVLFYLGNDTQRIKKGLDVAEAALKVARVQIPNAELCLVSRVLPDRMPLYYRAADVLLCTSKYEGSPNVVKEALACNLPVVSTPVGDVEERLKGVHPSAVVARDSNLLGKALAEILLMRKRSNGRKFIANLSTDNVAGQVLAVYQEVLGIHG
jgi:teichuronic acid biosynthesis glycosyltransferase TuaC